MIAAYSFHPWRVLAAEEIWCGNVLVSEFRQALLPQGATAWWEWVFGCLIKRRRSTSCWICCGGGNNTSGEVADWVNRRRLRDVPIEFSVPDRAATPRRSQESAVFNHAIGTSRHWTWGPRRCPPAVAPLAAFRPVLFATVLVHDMRSNVPHCQIGFEVVRVASDYKLECRSGCKRGESLPPNPFLCRF